MSKHVDRENEDLCASHICSLYPMIIPIISASHSDSLPCSLFATAFILVLLSLQNSMDPYRESGRPYINANQPGNCDGGNESPSSGAA